MQLLSLLLPVTWLYVPAEQAVHVLVEDPSGQAGGADPSLQSVVHAVQLACTAYPSEALYPLNLPASHALHSEASLPSTSMNVPKSQTLHVLSPVVSA